MIKRLSTLTASTHYSFIGSNCVFLSQKGKLKDNHKGDLVRIVRSNPVKERGLALKDNGHDFLYDVELVLGGKLNRVPRSELQYTTAHEEGMTGESRQRRKRKPTSSQDGPSKIKQSAAKKKKIPAANRSKTKNNGSKATTTKNETNKKRGSKNTGNTNGKKKSRNSQSAAAYNSETAKTTIVNTNNGGSGIGMFERHRREFERCLLRMQKLDVYNFFSDDDVPPEFDECYDLNSISKAEEGNDTSTVGTALDASIEPLAPTNSSSLIGTTTSSTKDNTNDKKIEDKATNSIAFPNLPPYNFIVLRKRLEQDRYLLDRKSTVENEDNFQSDGSKITTTTGMRDRSPSFSIQHPVGIHWELFRDDVIGMCNSAMERNTGNDDDDGSPGTLSNAAEKIKTAMEQIYEKTGRRQSQEMELSNDAHRFTKVLEATENKEAALQGKSWRKKGET